MPQCSQLLDGLLLRYGGCCGCCGCCSCSAGATAAALAAQRSSAHEQEASRGRAAAACCSCCRCSCSSALGRGRTRYLPRPASATRDSSYKVGSDCVLGSQATRCDAPGSQATRATRSDRRLSDAARPVRRRCDAMRRGATLRVRHQPLALLAWARLRAAAAWGSLDERGQGAEDISAAGLPCPLPRAWARSAADAASGQHRRARPRRLTSSTTKSKAPGWRASSPAEYLPVCTRTLNRPSCRAAAQSSSTSSPTMATSSGRRPGSSSASDASTTRKNASEGLPTTWLSRPVAGKLERAHEAARPHRELARLERPVVCPDERPAAALQRARLLLRAASNDKSCLLPLLLLSGAACRLLPLLLLSGAVCGCCSCLEAAAG